MSIITTYRAPLSLAPVKVARHDAGLTFADMARAMDLPPEWWGSGIIAVDGQVVPRHLWERARPRPDVHEVRFLLRLSGGGGDGEGKNPIALLGSLFLLAATGFIAGGGLAPFLGKSFAAGTFGARLAGGFLAAAGSQVLSRVGQRGGDAAVAGPGLDAARVPTASMAGNVLDPDGTVPRVLGTRKIFPPLASEPMTYFDGDDEVVEGVFVLSGPHQLTDIRLGNAAIDDMTGVEVQTREGWPGQAPQDLVRRQARTNDLGQELVPHRLQEDGITIDDSLGSDWQPVGTVFTTREAPEEVWIGMVFSQGLNIEAVTDDRLRVPIRVRIRRLGTETWANLPELHFVGASLRPIRFTIKLRWCENPSFEASAPVMDGFVEARIANPAQTATPAGAAFDADPAFVGTGDDYMVFSNLTATAVENVQLGAREAVIHLDTADFPPDIYEVEVTRGAAVTSDDYDAASYQVSGVVWDLFGAQGTGTLQVVADQKTRVSTLGILRASSVWNENPIATDDFAHIAIKARNVAAGQLSTVASGYVPALDGSGDVVTSNPAPHLRDVMIGRLNAKPVPEGVLDDAEISAWETLCTSKGYEINAIIDGGTVEDALNRIAAAGFARPRRSSVWGVISEFDTSVDDPEFIFTPRNSKGFALHKKFPDPPSGIRASFADADRDYAERQIIIPPGAGGGVLARRYDDQVTEADVIRAARFELQELASRSVSYVLTAPAEAIGMKRGDLVGVARDMLDRHLATGAGRVVAWTPDGAGDLATIRLDATVPVVNEDDVRSQADMRGVENVRDLGRTTYVAIRGEVAGAPVLTTHLLSNVTGNTDTLTLATPASGTGVHDGALIAVGPANPVTRRMKVSDLRRLSEFQAEVTLVAEAPELVANH